jgi:ankyrin repeat protein
MTTPLFTAVGSNNTAMAAALLTAGARVGDRTAEDKTILMHTLVSNPAMYALLIEARADVSAESMDHGTVLTCVLRQASEQQAEYARAPTRMLLEATGDAQAVDSNGLTVIMSAAADPNIHPNVFDILMNCFVEVTGKT